MEDGGSWKCSGLENLAVGTQVDTRTTCHPESLARQLTLLKHRAPALVDLEFGISIIVTFSAISCELPVINVGENWRKPNYPAKNTFSHATIYDYNNNDDDD